VRITRVGSRRDYPRCSGVWVRRYGISAWAGIRQHLVQRRDNTLRYMQCTHILFFMERARARCLSCRRQGSYGSRSLVATRRPARLRDVCRDDLTFSCLSKRAACRRLHLKRLHDAHPNTAARQRLGGRQQRNTTAHLYNVNKPDPRPARSNDGYVYNKHWSLRQ
jgi:hypothetical protein